MKITHIQFNKTHLAGAKTNQAPVIAKKCEARLRQSKSASNSLIRAYYSPSFAGNYIDPEYGYSNQVITDEFKLENRINIGEEMNFYHTQFFEDASFQTSSFDYAKHIMEKAVFYESANFLNTKFKSCKTTFKQAEFQGDTDFSYSQWQGDYIDFYRAIFGKKDKTINADFSNITAKPKKLSFYRATFNADVDFSNFTFEGDKFFFANTNVSKALNFKQFQANCDILNFSRSNCKSADFSESKLEAEGILFYNNNYDAAFNFSDSKLKAGSIDFSNTHFSGDADFSNTEFDADYIDFIETIFLGETDFSGATFKTHANFSGANFDPEKIDFTNAVFMEGADFSKAKPEELIGLLSGAYYKKGTQDDFPLPEGMMFEQLGLKPLEEKGNSDAIKDNIDTIDYWLEEYEKAQKAGDTAAMQKAKRNINKYFG